MLGLLYKDFFSAKKEFILSFVIIGLFVAYSGVLGQEEMLGPTIGVLLSLGSMIPTYSIYYDKTCGWNKFVCASPASRTKVVLSKYLMGILSALLFILAVILDDLASGSPLPTWSYPLFLGLIFFLQAIMLPVSLKLGQNVVVVLFMLLIFLPTGILFGLNRSGILTDEAIRAAFAYVQTNAATLAPVGLFLTLVLYVGSFFLTRAFYGKMEF